MEYKDVMAELETMGTAQNRKVYARHGVGENMFGVSYANIGKLKKKIKVDQKLAERLWASGNHDARVLATMIADPAVMDERTLEAWARDLDNYVVTDAFSSLAACTPVAHKKMEKWTRAKGEWVCTTGWNLLARLASAPRGLPDDFFEPHLEAIESQIHESKNRVRHAMNMALISIGTRSNRLEKKAVASAKRIGPVEVDHGETSCKTPDAAAYIKKTREYRAKKKKA